MNKVGIFPFGQPIIQQVQRDRFKKRVFVLGVYASAVHARWVGEDGCQKIGAVAVASEPEIFWRGCPDEAKQIIDTIIVPAGAGRLLPASKQLNGPSGIALDELFLEPLGFTREDAWLCDLVPHSCMNPNQEQALLREYDPQREKLGLPTYDWPKLPGVLADKARRSEIEAELLISGSDLIVTLGDLPLKWFTKFFGTEAHLRAYGQTAAEYGNPHSFTVAGRELQLLPLVHPRQAARLGTHSSVWADLHMGWLKRQSRKSF